MPTIISNAEELAAAIACMHEPEAFAQFCVLNQDFLNADEAQFAQLVPPERAGPALSRACVLVIGLSPRAGRCP